ncbi:MAG TPA: ATPase domain-containing protein [Bryobacteraceae bacterium]|nr:ATPase domain-containing protein [Bryobacteraceae bacterium]
MTEEQRQRAIRLRLARSNQQSRDFMPTGFTALDSALGGGLPRSSIVEIFGSSSSGKTTLALQIVARAQQNAATAAWIDAEHAFDAPYAASLGVLVAKMPLARPESAEQAFEIAARLLASAAVDLLIVDSAAALVPRLELQSAIGAGSEGLHSRVLASGLRKLARIVPASGAVAVFLNQTRFRASEQESSAGGPPLKLYGSLRLALESSTGDYVPFRVLKNKLAGAFREGRIRRARSGEFVESP